MVWAALTFPLFPFFLISWSLSSLLAPHIAVLKRSSLRTEWKQSEDIQPNWRHKDSRNKTQAPGKAKSISLPFLCLWRQRSFWGGWLLWYWDHWMHTPPTTRALPAEPVNPNQHRLMLVTMCTINRNFPIIAYQWNKKLSMDVDNKCGAVSPWTELWPLAKM